MRALRVIIALALGILFAMSSVQHAAYAQEQAPKDNKGFKADVLQVIDLGSEIEGMEGRQLRMRTLTIEPGGRIGLHSHKDRPSVVYFLKGTDTVITEDGTVKVFHPGETSSANKDTTHWHRNDGTEPVVLIAVDIFHPMK